MSKYLAIITGPTTVDQVGFRARRNGLDVRDCICIQRPEGPLFALIVRGPLESTVVAEVVRRGTGVYNIDAGRISTVDTLSGGAINPNSNAVSDTLGWSRPWMSNQEARERHSKGVRVAIKKAEELGRFPANLLLVHGPDCQCVGTKKVKPSNGSGTAHQDNKTIANQVYQGGWNPKGVSGTAGYAGDDGKEEVANWECGPSCPVAEMDRQSFEMGIHGAGSQRSQYSLAKESTATVSFGIEQTGGGRFGDSGGASRFFYQATSLDDIDDYMLRLIGQKPEYDEEQ